MTYKFKKKKKPLRIKRENNWVKLSKLIFKILDNCLEKIDELLEKLIRID